MAALTITSTLTVEIDVESDFAQVRIPGSSKLPLILPRAGR